jgi:GT2 family glycosyltransferase
MTQPTISVVIPTYHRNDLLAKCLDCLVPGVQTLTPDRYEVIVTDDGSQSTAEALIKSQYPWVKWVAGSHQGPAANRNNGAKYAQSEWLAFIDDDCIPNPNWLEAFLQKTQAGSLALEGAIVPVGNPNQDLAECPINLTGGKFWSANIFVQRLLFEEIGGFDCNFVGYFEDMDIHIRLAQRTKIIFVSDATVFHPVRISSLKKKIACTPRRNADWAYFVYKHRKIRGYDKVTQIIMKPYKIHLSHLYINIRHKYFKNACHELINLFFGIPLFWIYLHHLNSLQTVYKNAHS